MPIIDAILCGNYEYVRKFLEDGNNPNIFYGHYDGRGQFPLHVAVRFRQLEIVKLLLDHDADPLLEDHYGANALGVASNEGDVNIVKELLDRGMDANIKNKDGKTPINYTHNIHVIKLLITYGADVNNKHPVTGNIPLHDADNIDVMELLLKYGAHLNTKNVDGNTPLHYAVLSAHKMGVEALLNKGADLSIHNNENETPLQLAQKLLHEPEYQNFHQLFYDIIKIIEAHTYDDLKEPEFN